MNGELVKDVRIGDFAMPWETHDKITSIPKGYVRWYEWAYRPEGIKQVGCIYTAQGFEFDYVGVIIGNDLCVGYPNPNYKSYLVFKLENFIESEFLMMKWDLTRFSRLFERKI